MTTVLETETATTATAPSGYVPGLDGLRAIAVAAVVIYHLDASVVPGGYLGVDTFMVLSGFLITRLLLVEIDRTRRVDVRAFWVRRAKRLLPAALTFCVTATVIAALLYRTDQLRGIRLDAIASIFYVANWRFVLAHQSYFDLFAEPSPFRHLWSLAIEEQFYVVWPLVVFAVRRHRRALLALAVVLATGSAVSMALLVSDGDPSRAYYGTDTRMQTLLVGCVLAMLLHGRPLPTGTTRRAVEVAGLGAGVMMLAAFVLVADDQIWMYRGGFAAFAVCATVVVAAAVLAPGAGISLLLERAPMRWIGGISYSLYLWHWPAIVFLTPARLHVDGAALVCIRVAVTVAAAWVSARLIEAPIRHRSIRPVVALWAVAVSAALAAGAIVVVTLGATEPATFFSADGGVVSNTAAVAPEGTGAPTVAPKVLVLGDSVVASLTDPLLAASTPQGLDLSTAPVSGCGLLPGLTLDTTSQEVYEGSRPCAQMVPDALDGAFEQVAPDVVVWLSIWDAENRQIDDQRVVLETPEGRAALGELIGARVADLEARGATVVLVTVPVVATPDPTVPPSAIKQRRIEAYDEVLRQFAADHPEVGLIDLATYVCPDGDPCVDLDAEGRRYRPGDGIHYEGPAAGPVAEFLASEISRWTSAAAG